MRKFELFFAVLGALMMCGVLYGLWAISPPFAVLMGVLAVFPVICKLLADLFISIFCRRSASRPKRYH